MYETDVTNVLIMAMLPMHTTSVMVTIMAKLVTVHGGQIVTVWMG